MVINKEITETECNLWRKNKNINPKTNRRIKESSVIYNFLKNKCENDDIYKIVNDFCFGIVIFEIEPPPPPPAEPPPPPSDGGLTGGLFTITL